MLALFGTFIDALGCLLLAVLLPVVLVVRAGVLLMGEVEEGNYLC